MLSAQVNCMNLDKAKPPNPVPHNESTPPERGTFSGLFGGAEEESKEGRTSAKRRIFLDSANQALHMFSALHARPFNNNIFFLIFRIDPRSALLKPARASDWYQRR